MSLPIEFENRMRQMLGDEYNKFYTAFSLPEHHSGVRINIKKCPDAAKRLGLDDAVAWCGDGYYVDKADLSGNHPYHAAGIIYFQEPSAMVPVEALDICDGDYILDMCAAPGGKTTQAAAKLSGGLVVSNEISQKRAQILAENVSRLGFSNVVVTNESPDRIEARFPEFFDKIIIDAPCSGEGMFRKEEQASVCWSIEHTLSCATRQRAIIDSSVKCLRRGGEIVYSTCTFAKEENEDIINYILEKYPYMRIKSLKGFDMLSGGIDMPEARRIYPHKVRGEGHFAAVLCDTREKEERKVLPLKKTNSVEFRNFEEEFLNTHLDGEFVCFGDNVYLMPHGVSIDKLRVQMPGLHLGVCKKNRFEPSYALAHALNMRDIKNTLNFPLDADEVKLYLLGECIPCDAKGWTAVCVDGVCLGWGKASGGVLKNHFPKYLRLKR